MITRLAATIPVALRAALGLGCLALCGGGAMLCGARPAAADDVGRYALVVGVERYDETELAPLQWAEDDVEAIGAALERLGFSVVTMTSKSGVARRRPVEAKDILEQVERRLADREPGDTVVLCFSGHGVQLKSEAADQKGAKELYFCPERALPADPATLLPMTAVLERLARCAAGRKLLIVDACRDDYEPPNGSKSGRVIELPAAGFKRPPVPAGLVAIYSCSPGQRSFEIGTLGHSVFSQHLIEYLEGRAPADQYPGGEVGITDLTSYVRRKTRDTAEVKLGRVQTPDVITPEGTLAEWPLGRLGGGPRPAGGELASVTPRPLPEVPPVPRPASPPVTKREQRGEVVENSLGMKLVRIPAGEFQMGVNARDNIGPVHKVTISKPFLLGQMEVTQAQFEQVTGATPWRGQQFVQEGPDVAVSYVTWDEASRFCSLLTEIERRSGQLPPGTAYRLPTEAEWEYACRAGTMASFSFGDDDSRLGEFAWWGGLTGDGNAKQEQYAHPVGQLRPNPWNLFDIHGNVAEWCADWYAKNAYTPAAVVDPRGPAAGTIRVVRGGSWNSSLGRARSASRYQGVPPTERYSNLGFRVARDLE